MAYEENGKELLISRINELELSTNIDLSEKISEIEKYKETIKTNKRLYYDEQKDSEAKEQYYPSVLDIDNADSLFAIFHELLKKTHQPLPYFMSKDYYLYSWVDMQPDGSIKNIYSGVHDDPKRLIQKDYDIIQRKHFEFQQLLKNNNSLLDSQKKNINKIDFEWKFNTEHIVPQSWYGADEPMKGDLHHLFACQPQCNIKRSNFPYADFLFYTPESAEEKIKNRCGVVVDGKFEPEYGKGTVARAMLYFIVRYPRTIKKSFLPFINIPLLLSWHKKFEVSLYEKHRNYAIFQIQGNRNPFIDFPELASEMDFRLIPAR